MDSEAQDNQRLRKLAAAELTTMRAELERALNDRVQLHQDLQSLAVRLSDQEERNAILAEELEATRAQLGEELAEARAELAKRPPLPTPQSKQQPTWRRLVPAPAKKFVRRVRRRIGSGNAR